MKTVKNITLARKNRNCSEMHSAPKSDIGKFFIVTSISSFHYNDQQKIRKLWYMRDTRLGNMNSTSNAQRNITTLSGLTLMEQRFCFQSSIDVCIHSDNKPAFLLRICDFFTLICLVKFPSSSSHAAWNLRSYDNTYLANSSICLSLGLYTDMHTAQPIITISTTMNK